MNKLELLSKLTKGPAHFALEPGVAIIDETLWLPAVKGGVFFEGAVETARMVDPFSVTMAGNGSLTQPLFKTAGTGIVVVEDSEGPLIRVANTLHAYEPMDFTLTNGYPFDVSGYIGRVSGVVLDVLGLNQVQFTENITSGTYRLIEGSGCTQILTQASSGVVTYFSNKPDLEMQELVYYSYGGNPVKLGYAVPSATITRPDLSTVELGAGLITNYTIDLADVNATPGWYKISYLVPRSYCTHITASGGAIYVNSDSGREYTFYQERGEWQVGGSNLAPYEAGEVARFIVLNDTPRIAKSVQVLYDNDSIVNDTRRTFPGMVSVRVLDVYENPLSDVSVQASMSGATVIPAPNNRNSVTDSNGVLSFAIIPPTGAAWWDNDAQILSGSFIYGASSGTFEQPIPLIIKPGVTALSLARAPRALYSVNRMTSKVKLTPILNTGPLVMGNYTSSTNGQLQQIYQVGYSLEIVGGLIIDIKKLRSNGSEEYVYVNNVNSGVIPFDDGTLNVSYKRNDMICTLKIAGELLPSGDKYEETITL